jgi:hypothetical protein
MDVKRLALLLLMPLSACGWASPEDVNAQEEGADIAAEALAAANLAAGEEAEDPAALQARVERAMGVILRDPKSARYANVRSGVARSVCGEVDSKQENGRYGGMRPFVVTPEGVAVVSATAAIGFGDPADIFPDYYIRWCASPEELTRLGPAVRTPLPAPADPGVQADIPDIPTLDPQPPAGAPAGPPKARPPAEGGVEKDDSFLNSVVR